MVPEPEGGAVGGASTFNGHNMDTVVVILDFLERRLDRVGQKDLSCVVGLD